MTGVLLFCISEEAKQLTHKLLQVPDKRDKGLAAFYPAESREMVGRFDRFRSLFDESEEITTKWFVASVQECREWALEAWENNNKYLYTEFFFIADERSAKDDTLSVQMWPCENLAETERMNFPPFGLLPQEMNKWYEYRVAIDQTCKLHIHLSHLDKDIHYPVYLGHVDEFTNESGVFDVARAERIFDGEEKFETES